MSTVSISMFGRLTIQPEGDKGACSMPQKAQELLAYLVLHRRAHPREKLATLLWQQCATERSKAYLRKALWQLREALEPEEEVEDDPLLRADGDWLKVHPQANLWVDVAEFESAFNDVCDCTMAEMTPAQVRALQDAATLYTGDLLENWYHEWCLRHRERLQDMFLRMLDRLTRCCERREVYDQGIQYGLRILRIDPARERAHRQLMRLRALAGDRTGALRQYERCAEVLEQELGVSPTTATRRLHEKILTDAFPPSSTRVPATGAEAATGNGAEPEEIDGAESNAPASSFRHAGLDSLRAGLERIRDLQNTLAEVQDQIRKEITAVESVLQERQ